MRRIIILDDDEDLRQLLAELVEEIGCTCAVCAGTVGDLQRHAAEALSCDMALLDVNLGPGVPSGVDAYGWLRQQGFRGEIIFFTGHARSYPLLTEALAAPNVRLMAKPVDYEALEALLAGGAS